MKVLIISSSYLPRIGGLEIFVDSLAQSFSKAGHQSKVITQKYPRKLKGREFINGIEVNRYLFFAPKPPDLKLKSIIAYIYTLLFSPFNLIPFMLSIRRFKPDMINYHFVGTPTFFLLIYLFLCKNKLVVSLHGEDAKVLPSESKISMFLFKKVLKKANYITANSNYILNEAIKIAPFIRNKAKVIYNGINIEEFRDIKPDQEQRRYILSVGRLVYKKGFDVLIEAFSLVSKDIQDIYLIIAGDGPEREKLETLITAFGLKGRIKLYGWTTSEEIKNLMFGCEIFVLPSRDEPFGIIILEAMASGKPIIATRSGGPEEIIIDRQNGLLVEKENAVELAMVVLQLLGDRNLQRAIIDNAFAAVKKFQIQHVARDYLNIFEIAQREGI